jgi:hypothetical protein
MPTLQPRRRGRIMVTRSMRMMMMIAVKMMRTIMIMMIMWRRKAAISLRRINAMMIMRR